MALFTSQPVLGTFGAQTYSLEQKKMLFSPVSLYWGHLVPKPTVWGKKVLFSQVILYWGHLVPKPRIWGQKKSLLDT